MAILKASLILLLSSLSIAAATIVSRDSIKSDTTWRGLGSPYIIENNLSIEQGATLTIGPGVIVKFRRAGVEVSGALSAVGSEGEPVIFTAYQDDSVGGDSNHDGEITKPIAGRWGSIVFKQKSRGTLEGVTVRFGGGIPLRPNVPRGGVVEIFSSDVIVRNSIFTDNADAAIVATDVQAVIEGNTISKNRFALWLSGSAAAAPVKANRLSENRYNGIYIGLGVIDRSATWTADSTYILDGVTINGGASLKILPGTVVKSWKSSQVSVFAPGFEVYGSLSAIGTPSQPVVFTSWRDGDFGDRLEVGTGIPSDSIPSPGDWSGMNFRSKQNSSELENAIIRYGGRDRTLFEPLGANVLVACPQLTVRNCIVSDSAHAGIQVFSGNPTIVSNTITGNRSYGIFTENIPVTARHNFWGHPCGPKDTSDDSKTGGFHNPTGLGDSVTDFVDYRSWLPNDPNQGLFPNARRNGPKITRVSVKPRTVDRESVLTFDLPTEAAINYVIEFKNDLADTVWTLLRTISGDGKLQSFFEETKGVSLRFYRIRTVMQDVLRLKLPLPGGKRWLLTTEVGDAGCTASDPPEPSHTGLNHFSLDFSPRSSENSGEPEIDVRVFAAAAGRVAEIGSDPDSPNGFYVVLDHDCDDNVRTGYTTRYLHLKEIPLVTEKTSVVQGQQLGVMGETGKAKGIHLHIGLRFQDDGGSTEAIRAELGKVLMEGLRFEEFKTECKSGTVTPVKYYPSSNTQ